MPTTLGDEPDDDVSEPSVVRGNGLSVDLARECGPKLKPAWEAEDKGGDGIGALPLEEKGEEAGRWTYDGRAALELGIGTGVCSKPIAETEFRRFFKAAKAEDCGRSMSRP